MHMTITTKELSKTVLELHLNGLLSKEDYEKFIPEAEKLIEKHKKINLLIYLNNFRGWTIRALWKDLKFDAKHYFDVAAIAFIADKTPHQWFAVISKPFTAAKVKCFNKSQIADACKWLAMHGYHD